MVALLLNEEMHDPRIRKIRAATDLQHSVQYVQTYIPSSNSTRWGSLMLALFIKVKKKQIFGALILTVERIGEATTLLVGSCDR